jgi:hypothetical protein
VSRAQRTAPRYDDPNLVCTQDRNIVDFISQLLYNLGGVRGNMVGDLPESYESRCERTRVHTCVAVFARNHTSQLSGRQSVTRCPAESDES